MEQIIKEIQNLLIKLKTFNFKIGLKRKELTKFDFDDINSSFYENTNDIKNKLQNLFLSGNEETLKRVRTELKRLESILNQVGDYGFDIHVTEQKFNVTLEPKDLIRIKNIQLHCVQQLITYIDKLIPPQQTETKTDKLKAPVLGLFCNLIHKIGIDKKEETESATVYCERICNKFKLPYTDRVRQNYNVNETKKLMQDLTEKVLPLIDAKTKGLIEKYLDSKHPPKQNLYA
jgi:hypothetical protein